MAKKKKITREVLISTKNTAVAAETKNNQIPEGVEMVTPVFKTNNYSLFKFLKGNRLVRPRNLNRILQSMREKQLVIPVIVNEKMEIIDGQHRFLSSKELNLPIYFIIQDGYEIEDVERANRAGSNWDLNDFLGSFSEKGTEEYIELKEIVEMYGVAVSDLLKVIGKLKKQSAVNVIMDFKNENLNLTEFELTQLREFCDSLELFNTFTDYKTSRFVGSYILLYFQPKYNHETMKSKYATRGSRLVHKTTNSEYLTILCNEIYSYKLSGVLSITYNPSTNTFH